MPRSPLLLKAPEHGRGMNLENFVNIVLHPPSDKTKKMIFSQFLKRNAIQDIMTGSEIHPERITPGMARPKRHHTLLLS